MLKFKRGFFSRLTLAWACVTKRDVMRSYALRGTFIPAHTASSQRYPHLNEKNRIFACHLRWRCVNEHPNADSFFIGLFTNNCKKSDFIHLSVLSISIIIFLYEWRWHSRDMLSTRMGFMRPKHMAVRPPITYKPILTNYYCYQ